MQNFYPPTPDVYGKSPISDKSNISSISDPMQNMQNIPIPPELLKEIKGKGRGRKAAAQKGNESIDEYNARILKNEKAVITRQRIKERLQEFNVLKAKELTERLIKLNEPLKTSSKSSTTSPAKIKKSN